MSFENCTWWRNSGQFGSAIAILPNAWNLNTDGYLPTVYYSNCKLDSNSVIDDLDSDSTFIRQYTKGSGALFCTDHTFEFSNHNSFLRNNGSAFYMGACIARFSKQYLVSTVVTMEVLSTKYHQSCTFQRIIR